MKQRSIRQSFLGEHSDDRLQQTTIAIIGASGGGSPTNLLTSHVGFGTTHIFDPDFAEEHHRHRMVGITPAAVKHKWSKVRVAQRLAKLANPEGRFVPHPYSWQSAHEVLRTCDIVFSCVDGYVAREEIERYLRRFHVPLIDIGMDVIKHDSGHQICGQVILSMPGQHCMRCYGFLRDDLLAREAAKYGAAGENAQVIWPNTTLASAAVGMAVSLLLPWHEGISAPPYLVYDGNRMELGPSPRLQHLEGIACPHYGEGTSFGDPHYRLPATEVRLHAAWG